KISKRKEMDVSTFRAGIRIVRKGDAIASAAVAYAGVGPTAGRLPRTEAFLAGRPFTEATFREAGPLPPGPGEPSSRVRGSRDFRLRLAENILLKFYHEVIADGGGGPTEGLSHANGWAGSVQVETRAAPAAPGPAGFPSVGRPVPHESARAHVTGRAVYL